MTERSKRWVVSPPELPSRYVVRERIGNEVYEALDTTRDETVAIKILSTHVEPDTDITRLFRQKILLAGVEHPGIVKLLDSGMHGMTAYTVLERLRGQDLQDRPPSSDYEEIARIIGEAAAALACLHRHGIAHRRVQPSHIFVDTEGRAHLVGLDLAMVIGEPMEDEEIWGNPMYRSPEQCLDLRASDGRSDVYSLGLVLYELLTHEIPFSGYTTVVELVMQKLAARTPSPRSVSRRIPRELDAICVRALAREPDDRYQDADAMAEALGAFADGRRRR